MTNKQSSKIQLFSANFVNFVGGFNGELMFINAKHHDIKHGYCEDDTNTKAYKTYDGKKCTDDD